MGKGNLALGKRKPRLGQVTLVDIYIYIYIEASSSSTVLLLLQKMRVRTGSLEYKRSKQASTLMERQGPLAVRSRRSRECGCTSRSVLVRLATTQDFLIKLSMLDWTCRACNRIDDFLDRKLPAVLRMVFTPALLSMLLILSVWIISTRKPESSVVRVDGGPPS